MESNKCRNSSQNHTTVIGLQKLLRRIPSKISQQWHQKAKNSQKKIDSTKIERNILGRTLCVAMKNTVDLQSILSYPLTDVPHTFAHYEESLQPRVQKSELVSLLSKKEASTGAEANSAHQIDVDFI